MRNLTYVLCNFSLILIPYLLYGTFNIHFSIKRDINIMLSNNSKKLGWWEPYKQHVVIIQYPMQ